MTPSLFEEANTLFRPPFDLEESQCMSIAAHVSEVTSGSMDGVKQIVVAWLPTGEDLKRLQQGDPLYITFMGVMPPHYPSTNFHDATHPA